MQIINYPSIRDQDLCNDPLIKCSPQPPKDNCISRGLCGTNQTESSRFTLIKNIATEILEDSSPKTIQKSFIASFREYNVENVVTVFYVMSLIPGYSKENLAAAQLNYITRIRESSTLTDDEKNIFLSRALNYAIDKAVRDKILEAMPHVPNKNSEDTYKGNEIRYVPAIKSFKEYLEKKFDEKIVNLRKRTSLDKESIKLIEELIDSTENSYYFEFRYTEVDIKKILLEFLKKIETVELENLDSFSLLIEKNYLYFRGFKSEVINCISKVFFQTLENIIKNNKDNFNHASINSCLYIILSGYDNEMNLKNFNAYYSALKPDIKSHFADIYSFFAHLVNGYRISRNEHFRISCRMIDDLGITEETKGKILHILNGIEPVLVPFDDLRALYFKMLKVDLPEIQVHFYNELLRIRTDPKEIVVGLNLSLINSVKEEKCFSEFAKQRIHLVEYLNSLGTLALSPLFSLPEFTPKRNEVLFDYFDLAILMGYDSFKGNIVIDNLFADKENQEDFIYNIISNMIEHFPFQEEIQFHSYLNFVYQVMTKMNRLFHLDFYTQLTKCWKLKEAAEAVGMPYPAHDECSAEFWGELYNNLKTFCNK